jgi:surface protein
MSSRLLLINIFKARILGDCKQFKVWMANWILIVDNVTDMSRLFEGLDTFDADISRWEVDQVTDMILMFYGASSFDNDISSWNTSKVI